MGLKLTAKAVEAMQATRCRYCDKALENDEQDLCCDECDINYECLGSNEDDWQDADED